MNKFRVDLLFNLAGLAVVGLSGIVVNLLIAHDRGPAALGVFNQVFSFYILFSQIAVFGVHHSVLKSLSSQKNEKSQVFSSSFVLALVLGSLMSLLFYLLAGPLSQLVNSPDVKQGVEIAAWALLFFAVNKVFLAAFNGMREMKAFAAYNSLRWVFIVAAIGWVLFSQKPSHFFIASLPIAECLLSFLMIIHLRFFCKIHFFEISTKWLLHHFQYGLRSVLGGVVIELNTRVDVLMLGLFLDDAKVGIYSLAATIAEGLFQALVVVRNNYNPIIAKEVTEKNWSKIQLIIKSGKIKTGLTFLGLSLVAAMIFPLALALFGQAEAFAGSWTVFLILLGGICIHAPYAPFFQTLLVGGFPGRHTLLLTLVVAVNFVGNGIFIPLWGIQGAAVGTALSFIFSNIALLAMTQKAYSHKLI